MPLVVLVPSLQAGLLAMLTYIALACAIAYAVYLLKTRPPGGVPRAVGLLIAAISLLDAAFIAGVGATGPVLLAAAGFLATVGMQRYISGT